MSMVKMVLNWCKSMVLNIVALIRPTTSQEAWSRRIWPDHLKPVKPNNQYWQDVLMVHNNFFYAPLALPLGATITKVTYYHLGGTSRASTTVSIIRLKMGNLPETLGSQSSRDSTGEIIPVGVVLTGDPMIRAEYRYYIWVESKNEDSYFMGAKINYQQ